MELMKDWRILHSEELQTQIYLTEKHQEKKLPGNVHKNGIILKWISEEQSVKIETQLNYLRIEFSVELL
jgi:hypothetical protein